MGNAVMSQAPAQVLGVESYLEDVSDCIFDKSLRSTRFLKARTGWRIDDR